MKELILAAWDDRSLLNRSETRAAVEAVIAQLDRGTLRVAEPMGADAGGAASAITMGETGAGGTGTTWRVNEWVKKAVILYFPLQQMRTWHAGELEFHDKMALKHDYATLGVRVVPHGVARYGAYVAPGVVMMPSYINIGAYVDEGTMVDTWATVGSCAQVGKRVHLSGGVGLGGVLEPVQAAPVIIEDDCFVGSRCIVVEGAHIGSRAVLGANVVITGSTHVLDVSGEFSDDPRGVRPEAGAPVEFRGWVPSGAVVIPGTYPKCFPAGEYQVPCALIIGRRKESTDLKTSLNAALRDNNVAV